MQFTCAYNKLSDRDFSAKIKAAKKLLQNCCLCPHECGINRNVDSGGKCKAQASAEVAHYQLHFGEEPPLSSKSGAGTIFFSHCNLECVFCQNHQISQPQSRQRIYSSRELSRIMLLLENQGAQNIDLVSPTHFIPAIIEAVYLARKQGLDVPIVYNSNGYDSRAGLKLLDGIVDIYMPDFKYANSAYAKTYSQAIDYFEHAKRAIRLMYEQVGDLVIDDEGIARRGLLIRHLVLPNNIAGSIEILDFLKERIGTRIGLSIMSQYAPCYKAFESESINRTIYSSEYALVVDHVQDFGFANCWIQELKSNTVYFPDFEKSQVF